MNQEQNMYHLCCNGEKRGPYALDQVRSMWSSGIITEDTLFWSEKEQEWRPLSELLAVKETGPPQPPTAPVPLLTSFPEVETIELPVARPAKKAYRKKIWILVGAGVILMAGLSIGIIALTVPSPEEIYRQGMAYLNGEGVAKDPAEAKANTPVAVPSSQSVSDDPYYKSAKRAEKDGELDSMLKEANALVKQHPKSGLALRCLADALYYKEDDQSALAILEKAIEIDPIDVVAWNDKALVYKSMSRTSDAEDAFKRATRLGENQPKPWADYGAFYISQKNEFAAELATDKALRLLKQAPFDTHQGELNEASVWYTVARNYEDLKKPVLAEQAYKRVTEIIPDDADAWLDLASVYDDSDNLALAEQAYKHVTEIDPNNANAWHGLALIYSDWSRNDSINAIRCFEKYLSLKHEFDNPILWTWLGREYSNVGRFDEAIAAHLKYIKTNQISKGDSLCTAWYQLGEAYDEKGRMQDAVEAYRKSLALISPEQEKCFHWFHIGWAYERMGRRDEAAAAYREADRDAPGFSAAEKANLNVSVSTAQGTHAPVAPARANQKSSAEGRGQTNSTRRPTMLEERQAEEAVAKDRRRIANENNRANAAARKEQINAEREAAAARPIINVNVIRTP